MRKHRQILFWIVFLAVVLLSGFFTVSVSSSIGVPTQVYIPITHSLERPKMAHKEAFGLSLVQIENKRIIEDFFPDLPILVKVFGCESGFRQFDDNGDALMSNTGDYGIAQINKKVWGDTAISLGLDIYGSLQDNLKMARYVYNRQGLSAWVCYDTML